MAVGGRSSGALADIVSAIPPAQLLCLLGIAVALLGFWGYAAFEAVKESLREQMSILVMLCPLLLLLLLHWISSCKPLYIPLPGSQPSSIHKAGGSPWGVGLLLILLILMISYQSTFHESWFPFFYRYRT